MSASRTRRSRRSLAQRLRVYWIVGVVAAGALVWGGWTLATLPVFHLRSLSVSGLDRVSAADVRARAAIDAHTNVWLQDRGAMARRIEAIPYVETARISIRPPADVEIAVTERVAEGCVHDPSGQFTIDAERRVLALGCADAPPLVYVMRAPIDARPGAFVADPELEALQADARALAAGTNRYRAFGYDEFGELDATLVDGIHVRFGDDADLARKESLVGPILAQLGPRAGTVVALDLRAPAAPVVQFRPLRPAHPHSHPHVLDRQ